MEKFSLFKNIWETKPVGEITVQDMCQIIKDDAIKPYIDNVRSATTKADKDYAKKQLPNVTINGIFPARGNNNIIEYSGLTCLDFDHIPKEDWKFWRDGLLRWEYTHALFTSPSGEGLKLILRHDLKDASLHGNLYGQLIRLFKETYGCPYIDTSVKDLSRATYLSFDPDCYLNENASVCHFEFDPTIPETTKNNSNASTSSIPTAEGVMTDSMIALNEQMQLEWTDKSIINYIDKHEWSNFPEDYNEGNRNYSILRKAGQLYRCGVCCDATVEKLVHLYSHTFADVPENDVVSRVKYIYNLHSDDFGSQRQEWLDKRNTQYSRYRLLSL